MKRALTLPSVLLSIAACTSSPPPNVPTAAPPTPSFAASTPTTTAAPTPTPSAPTAATTPAPTRSPVPTLTSDAPAWAIQYSFRRPEVEVFDALGGHRFAASAGVPGRYHNNPDWSPDGDWLTFTVEDGGQDDLWVVGLDGNDARRVYDCAEPCMYVDDPAWSPDGRTIAVCKMTGTAQRAAGSLTAVDVATGSERLLYESAQNEFCAGPRWSPDGSEIVMEIVIRVGPEVDAEARGVYLGLLDLSTQPVSVRALTDPSRFAATADWSRANGLIVFNMVVEPGVEANDLYTLPSEGGQPTRLTFLADEGGSAIEPAWDATGENVIFVRDGQLMRVDLVDGNVEPAFDPPIFGNHPRARPLPR